MILQQGQVLDDDLLGIGPLEAQELIGYGRVSQRDGDLFWADVEIASATTQALLVRGLVVYRIVT